MRFFGLGLPPESRPEGPSGRPANPTICNMLIGYPFQPVVSVSDDRLLVITRPWNREALLGESAHMTSSGTGPLNFSGHIGNECTHGFS